MLSVVKLALSVFTWSIIIYVVLSWVSPGGYNPGAALVAAIVEPVLAPFRRLIPAIGGLDLSPLFALIAIQATLDAASGRPAPVGHAVRVAGALCVLMPAEGL